MRFHLSSLKPLLHILLGCFISYLFFYECPSICPNSGISNSQKSNLRRGPLSKDKFAMKMDASKIKSNDSSNEHRHQNKTDAITKHPLFDQQINEADGVDKEQKYRLLKHQKVVFIEGLPRSGTTLMRVLLDSDPDIYCGPESTFLVQLFMYCRNQLNAINADTMNAVFINESHFDRDMVISAMRGLVLGYLQKRSAGKRMLCEKHLVLIEFAR